MALINAYPLPRRIPKIVRSLYEHADPPLRGHVALRRFDDARVEARAIAETCRKLIEAGVPPGEQLVLISNRRALARVLTDAFDEAEVPYEGPSEELYKDTRAGRFALALLRIVCNPDDYVAHRTLMGLQRGVGERTCNRIAHRVVEDGLDYRDLFYGDPPGEAFSTREANAISGARRVLERVAGWSQEDLLHERVGDLSELVAELASQDERDIWLLEISPLPEGATLEETRDLLWAETAEQESDVILAAYARTDTEPPDFVLRPPGVRLMTMHVAKGLSAQIVFVPGLEEEIFPGDRRRSYPGLVLEAARLLYMSLTRARAGCIVSYSTHRVRFGQYTEHTPSRFAADLGGAFIRVSGALSDAEVESLAATCSDL
jgi:DNA helicase-2/ATP-dependent DNA helicase PcrA